MPLPTASAVRRAGIAAVLGAGLALVAGSVSGIAAIDGRLRAATERPRAHVERVSDGPWRAGACPRPHWQRVAPAPAPMPTT